MLDFTHDPQLSKACTCVHQLDNLANWHKDQTQPDLSCGQTFEFLKPNAVWWCELNIDTKHATNSQQKKNVKKWWDT